MYKGLKIAICFIIISVYSTQFCFAEFDILSLFRTKKNYQSQNCEFHQNKFNFPYIDIAGMDCTPVFNVNIMYNIDIDGDGIANRFDDCPATFGLASLNGCPPVDFTKSITYGNPSVYLSKEDFNLMIEIFSNLEFEGEHQTVSKASQTKLDSLVKFLKKHRNLYLYISSYVNVGSNRMQNYYLSESRAISVQKFLSKNGIDNQRIGILFFGDMMPVVDLPPTRFEVEICDRKKN
jgi:flagellar motor protein MotB